MYCIRCGKETPQYLCDACLKYSKEYIKAYDDAVRGGVIMSINELDNRNRDAKDVQEALERRENANSHQPQAIRGRVGL